ncbi:Planctomycete cytochrome C [Psychroflexus salarius]|uniref:Planctomycete cytochrome C n=1 Tax=Psychroflexus salarius TaxID=1155689 RepID=A0A1M4SMB1_9FLAO|nr:c-type cytochrome domain-containing protein [Psychroflexus salarius]SHE33351.1 Planctomycete cytochrome C [Psychroflexus salarius]
MIKNYCYILVLISLVLSCSEAVIEDTEAEPVVETVFYNPDIKSVVDNFCISCHNDVSANSGLNLSNYDLVKDAAENGNLILRINDVQNPMPPSGLLPSSERALFDKWVADGFPENENEE